MAYYLTPSTTTSSSGGTVTTTITTTTADDAAYELAVTDTQPTLEAVLVELRVLSALVADGLNVKDDPATLRADPSFQNTP